MFNIHNISRKFGTKTALENVSFQLKEGTCFGLIGPNGAGKSTMMKIMIGIIQSDQGTIHSDIPREKIGYVPQEICLEENVSALQNLIFFGRLFHLKGKSLQRRADEVLAYIGLSERKKDPVKAFSGGMKRRLNIGCALMNEPRLIIMDEPTVGIDPQSRRYILNMIQQMKMEKRTVIYSTHYMEEAEKICDELALIDKGKIIEQNNLEDLLQSYAVPSVFFKMREDHTDIANSFPVDQLRPFENGYVLETENPTEAMEAILQIMKKNGLTLEKFEVMQPRLEDLFFTLTGSELRA